MRRFMLERCLTALLIALSACDADVTPPPDYDGPLRYDGPVWPEAPTAPLSIPLEDGWRTEHTACRHAADALTIPATARDDMPRTAFSGNLTGYTHVELTLQADTRGELNVHWAGDAAPNLLETSGAPVKFAGGGGFQTVRAPLHDATRGPAYGAIQWVGLHCAEGPATVQVRELKFIRLPDVPPPALAIDAVTREVVARRTFSWTVRPPENAALVVPTGTIGVEGSHRMPGRAGFKVSATNASGEPITLAADAVDDGEAAGWRTRHFDLAEHAGRELTLSFNHEDDASGDGWAYWGRPFIRQRETKSQRPNVILISCDTWRARNLPMFGYARDTAPFLREFVNDATLFTQAYTPEPWTLTAHMTMFTGRYPWNHGVDANINLAPGIATLPEWLRDAGYLSAGFTGHRWWLMASRGFGRGLETYDTGSMFRDVFVTWPRATAWLDHYPDHPFFLFLHNYDMHSVLTPGAQPYHANDERFTRFADEETDPPELPAFEAEADLGPTTMLVQYNRGKLALSQAHAEYFQRLYDDCVMKVDAALEQFINRLKAQDRFDNSLIVITSDHGENLGENDLYLHENLYDPTLHIPLIVRFPNGEHAGKRIDQFVHLADIAPTVLDVLDLPIPDNLDGRSLRDVIERPAETRAAYVPVRISSETGVRTESHKLVQNFRTGARHFFDLVNDPGEHTKIPDEGQPQFDAARAAHARHHEAPRDAWTLTATTAGNAWNARITGANPDALPSLWAPRYLTRGEDNRSFRIVVDVKRDRERVIAAVGAQPDSATTITIETFRGPFTIAWNGTTHPPATRCTLELTPAGPTLRALEESNATPDARLTLTYRAAAPTGAAAVMPSQEELEQLEALGYIGD